MPPVISTPQMRVVAGNLGAWASLARQTATDLPVYDGDIEQNKWIVLAARWYLTRYRAMVILTRDNLVRLGFWKNAEFENCLHLSISFRHPETFQPEDWSKAWAREITQAVFGKLCTFLWWEPAYSETGKRLNVGHYRLFLAPDWITPVLPKGEPYTVSPEMGGSRLTRWTEAQADLPTPNFNADITAELPLRREAP